MGIKTVLITQARTGSTRLPGKVMKEVNGKTLLQIHLERLKKCTKVSKIIVATTVEEADKIIYDNAKKWGYEVSRGSESDVLDRFYQALKTENADWVVRVTSDCPLLDPSLVDNIITYAHANDLDYITNGLIETFPDGQDVEVFKFSALEIAWKNSKLKSEREHVTPYIRNNADGKGENIFTTINFPSEKDYAHIRMTVDEPRDFDLIEHLIQKLGTEKTWLEYTDYIIAQNLTKLNAGIIRNEGFLKSLKKD
ncbi:cytidylyltransferase domain-containing protein [Winogradskyella forsetii]|uniref:cytidylyltransferase domain-containing protein n=1 Tax=Winogradskyella forsetii TaxID=2686077 RepID=UPI001C4DCA06|nr:glycosyltransferase family protein [Winogradskyella forsetii]